MVCHHRARELSIAVEYIGVSGIESEYGSALIVEYHDAACEDNYTGAVIEIFPVQRLAPVERYLDECSFYHKLISIETLVIAVLFFPRECRISRISTAIPRTERPPITLRPFIRSRPCVCSKLRFTAIGCLICGFIIAIRNISR